MHTHPRAAISRSVSLSITRSLALSILSLALVCAIGCSNESTGGGPGDAAGPGPNDSSSPLGVPTGEFNYKLDGTNSSGETCTTGTQSFATRHLLCINIQDPVRNADCALDMRIVRFNELCRDEMEFFDSLSCRVVLLKPDAVANAWEGYRHSDVLHASDYCAGRTSRGLVVGGSSVNGRLHQDVWMNMSIQFVEKSRRTVANGSLFQMSLYRPASAPGTRNTELLEPFEYKLNGFTRRVLDTRDRRHKVFLQCGPTWACDASK